MRAGKKIDTIFLFNRRYGQFGAELLVGLPGKRQYLIDEPGFDDAPAGNGIDDARSGCRCRVGPLFIDNKTGNAGLLQVPAKKCTANALAYDEKIGFYCEKYKV